MAQQPDIDQRKLFMQVMFISMVIWLVVIMSFSYFRQPPVSDKPAEQIIADIERLRADKEYVEASRLASGLATRFRGTELGAIGLLLEAKIFYEDQQNAREAYNRLRQMEEFYAHTEIFRREGRALLQKVGQEIDQYNRQFWSYRIIDTLVALFGRKDYSYMLAIVTIAGLVRLILIPLTNKQFASMRKMMQIAPKLQELQQKYSGQELQMRMMNLYKKYGVNPFSGCLYALIPIPFLIWMYNMFLLYQVQFQKGHFLWMNPDFAERFPGYVAAHLGQFDAPLMLIYAISMYLTSRLTITDPTQAQMQKTMALITTVMLVVMFWAWRFPSAFILYWMLTNVFYTIHYKLYMRKPVPELVPVVEQEDEEKNGAPQANKKRGYQPPKKRSKRK